MADGGAGITTNSVFGCDGSWQNSLSHSHKGHAIDIDALYTPHRGTPVIGGKTRKGKGKYPLVSRRWR